MTHTLGNLERHQVKHPKVRQPRHEMGARNWNGHAEFLDGIYLQDNDIMEINRPQLGCPLRSPVKAQQLGCPAVVQLRMPLRKADCTQFRPTLAMDSSVFMARPKD